MMLMDDENQIKLSFKYVNAIEYALTVSLLNIKQFFHRISKLLPLLNWLKLLNGHIFLLLLLLYTVHEIIRRQYKYGIFKWCALFLWKIMKNERRKKNTIDFCEAHKEYVDENCAIGRSSLLWHFSHCIINFSQFYKWKLCQPAMSSINRITACKRIS